MKASAPAVLVVGDEEHFFKAVARSLGGERYKLASAHDAEEGLTDLKRHRFDIVLSDDHLPGMSGVDFLELARVRYPSIVRLMISSNAGASEIAPTLQRRTIFRLLPKPWNDADLKAALRFALQYARELALEEFLNSGER